MSDTGWTPTRVETLTSLWRDGLSASQVAKALGGVTRNAVIGKVHRLGLSGRAAGGVVRRPAAAGQACRRHRHTARRTGSRLPPRACGRPLLPVADR
jgi:GcrA cell cycle regulator